MGRASILDSLDDDEADLDLSRFTPKAGPDKDALSAEQVRAIAEASNFPSREPKPRSTSAAPPAAPAPEPKPDPSLVVTPQAAAPKREPRRHRTGRTMQFNARTTPQTVEAFYAIADSQGWLVGETVERALAALQRELADKTR